MEQSHHIRALIDRVRTRWRLLKLFDALARAGVAMSAALALAVIVSRWFDRSPLALVVIAGACAVAWAAALVWTLAPVRDKPSDHRVARFIEERDPALDDRLATAVDVSAATESHLTSVFSTPMVADAAERARAVDIDTIVPDSAMRRGGLRIAGAALMLASVGAFAWTPAVQAFDAAALLLFPERLQLSVQPGDTHIAAGAPLVIEARLAGNRAPVDTRVRVEEGNRIRNLEMSRTPAGAFRLSLDSVASPFTYRVTAGSLTSRAFNVSVVHPPRIVRIDLEYKYPPSSGLKPHSEEDGGDIYAPAGTDVRVRVHSDRPAASGRIVLGDGKSQALAIDGPTALSATLKIAADNSYRITLADGDGFASPGDTEYFIRVLEDRPPEVHITRPAGDRAVTRLEEVDIDVLADDDRGIERLELVYAVRGSGERVVPLATDRRADVSRSNAPATSVSAHHTLYLEDLDVQSGDFVSYFARVRDVSRGKRGTEARSDIFFLEVKPYEQEFSLAMSQSMAGSGYTGALEEIVNRQRQVVVATWKIDRRAENANGARSDRDIRAIAKTEADLKAHVEQTASTFRESTMRDPRQRGPVAGSTGPRDEEDAMAIAADAMGRATTSLEALNTAGALPPEMQALNALLKAEADIKRRQISTNQSAAGSGNNNRNYDISTLFDRELRRQQQTSYETNVPERREAGGADADRIKELANRQDELLRRQQALQAAEMSDEERTRELERLTRDQSELRQRAEELARRMTARDADDRSASSPNIDGSAGQQGRASRGSGAESRESQLRDASQAMGRAAGDFRRGAPQQAATNGSRALDVLRDLERRLRSSPDDRRRASGDMQLEARQLADLQRQIASELGKARKGDAASDERRRLAGEQERLAKRMRRLQADVNEKAGQPRANDGRNDAKALRDAAKDLAGLSDRMTKAADEMRAARPGAHLEADQEDIARQLNRLADRLATAGGSPADSAKLSEQLARAQALRDKLDQLGRALQNATVSGRSSDKKPGESGRIGEGRRGAGGVDMSDVREEALRQLQETQKLLDEMRRDDPNFSRNGAGFTFEGQGMVFSAPGTEAFKQDFAKWDRLKKQATLALEQMESAAAKKLQAQQSKDRLATGVDDRAPSQYQPQVDAYFKALATKKQ